MKYLKRSLLFLLFVVIALAGVILVRTLTFASRQRVVTLNPAPQIDPASLKNFTSAIRFRTVSHSDSSLFDSAQFLGFRRFLETTYPLTHAKLNRTIVKNYTLVYRWEGNAPQLRPVVLMAHQDVVPVEEATRAIWTVDPFEGVVRDNYIWGRGATDDKINLISILESVEKLLRKGFQPNRTIYLVFGHDEEIGGAGAQAVAEWFRKDGIRPELVLDEGGIVTREKVPGLNRTVALIGTSEKGILTVQLKVEKGGGHSAMPERETAIDILARAITTLNDNEFEARFSPSTESFMECVGPEMPFGKRIAFANLWLFKPVIYGIYEKSAPGNAMIRTTMVPTILRGGVKENVVPTFAAAIVNLRLLPGDSSVTVLRKIRNLVNDDRVQIDLLDAREASGVTPMESFAYQTVDQIVRQTYDSVVATPFLMIGATDSRHFSGVSGGIIKFSPMVDPIGFHGIDERVSMESFRESMWFFEQLMRDLK
jgi:carboxypeptidase PM20D1